MNKHLLRLSGLATLMLLLHTAGFAQSGDDKDTSISHLRDYDEIIIKRNSEKDAKVTVEIKNGEVFIDGKPAADYKGDNLSVRKRKIRIRDGRNFSFIGPDGDVLAPPPPGAPGIPDDMEYIMPPGFRNGGGTWNYDGKGLRASQAFLGVTSAKQEDGPQGAKIKDVSENSAAEKAGLKVGDLITKVDDKTIESPETLSEAIRKYKPQDKVTITFKREGKEQKVTATLGKFNKVQTFQYKMPKMENFKYDDLNDQLWKFNEDMGRGFGMKGHPRLGIKAQDTEEGKGVKVLDVDEGSNAEKAGIKEGDIITKFDGKDINSTPDLIDAAQASKDKPSVHVNLLRSGKALDVDIKTPKKLKTANL